MLTQEAQLAQTRATLPPLQKQLAQTRNQLAALVGQLPVARSCRDVLRLTACVCRRTCRSACLRSLVEQRPDVRAAEAQLHAASRDRRRDRQSAAAVQHHRQPWHASNNFTNMFAPGTGVWSIAGGVTQTSVRRRHLLHRKRAAVAAFEQTAAQYRSTVIKACQNVADTLRALQSDADAHRWRSRGVRAFCGCQPGSGATAVSTGRHRLPDSAERAADVAAGAYHLVQAEANRYADTAALFQALGGGWWHRSDVAPQVADNAKQS